MTVRPLGTINSHSIFYTSLTRGTDALDWTLTDDQWEKLPPKSPLVKPKRGTVNKEQNKYIKILQLYIDIVIDCVYQYVVSGLDCNLCF